jgi:Kef-type K+ transport system membrane component KefB
VTGAPFPGFAFLAAGAQDAAAIPLALLLVFGSAKLLAEICERLNQPSIVGEILAGVLIGPSVLGWISPDQFLTTMSELGVMFLLFRVGLKVKASELLRVGGTATLVATLGVVAPFFLGWGILRLWGEPQTESIFVGAAMVATSVGITARVLSAGSLLRKRFAQIILAAAVIDDVLGLLVLALVSSLARGRVNPLELSLTAALAIGFTVLVAAWGSKTMRRFVPHMEGRLRAQEAQFALAVTLLFALSLLAVYAGVAAIVGAFLAGMALAESVGQRVQDLAHGVAELLVPFFLVGIGLRVDLAAFTHPSVAALAAVIVLAAILSKLAGCGLGAYRLGRAEALRVGLGMVPRGEVGMVVAQLGLTMGVIRQDIYGVVVFMSVATTLLAPLLLAVGQRPQRP